MEQDRKYIGIVPLVIVSCILGMMLGYSYCRQNLPTINEKTKTDTLYLRDTITEFEPIFKVSRVVDTFYVAVNDTIVKNDTTFILLPKEEKLYESDKYRVGISGYGCNLDYISVFAEDRIVTKETIRYKQHKWGLGIQTGIGAGKGGLSPYIGLGISYNFLNF